MKTTTKKIKYAMYLIAVIISLSSCTHKSAFEKKAIKQLHETMDEKFSQWAETNISDVQTKWCDDSLCIVHFLHSAKNTSDDYEVGDRIEYVLLKSGDKEYELVHPVRPDSVFVNPVTYIEEKKNKIYESLQWTSGLHYFATLAMNKIGREVGDKEWKGVDLPVRTGTGEWQIVKDENASEDGKMVSSLRLQLEGRGKYQDELTYDGNLTATLQLRAGDRVKFILKEDGSQVVKPLLEGYEAYKYSVTDGQNMYHPGTIECYKDGYFADYLRDDIREILNSEGVCTFNFDQQEERGLNPSYIFKMDVRGFKKANEMFQNILRKEYESSPNVLFGKAYMDSCSRDTSYKRLSGGGLYKVFKMGKGAVPRADDRVRYNVQERIAGVAEYQKGYTGVSGTIRNFFPWFKEIMTLLPVGSECEIVIPEGTAYGDRRASYINPFLTLIMRVELLEIDK